MSSPRNPRRQNSCAFAFGYKDHPEKPNPAEGLDSFRITKKDRPKIDPFTIHEAERLIQGLHVEWGEPIGNYDEFRFFTGLRQSEEIALRTLDCNLEKATIEIRQVIVAQSCLGGHGRRGSPWGINFRSAKHFGQDCGWYPGLKALIEDWGIAE